MSAQENTRIQNEKSKWYKVDKDMIPAKLCYFLNDGFFGSINPFFNLFYRSIGLTYTQMGLVTGTSYAISSLAGPLFGSLADKTGRRKLIFSILCLGAASFVFPLPFVAEMVGIYNKDACRVNSTNESSKLAKKCSLANTLTNPTTLFHTMLVLTIAARFFFMALPSYLEGIVMNVVNNNGKKYGTQKLFSSVGYAFFNFIALVVNEKIILNNYSEYTPGFFVFLLCVMALLPIGIVLVGQSKWEKKIETKTDEKRDKKQIFSKVMQVCKKLDSVIYLMTVTISGIAINVLQSFGLVILEDNIHGTKIGMAVLVQILVVSEIFFYCISSKLIKFLGGPFPAMIFGLFSYFPRYVIMSYCSNQWIILPVNIIHGLGLGMPWVAQMEYSYKIFPKDIKMTGINIVCTLHAVVCGSVTNILGGIICKEYGGLWLFRGCGILCGVWAIFAGIYYKLYRQKETKVQKFNESRFSTITEVDVD